MAGVQGMKGVYELQWTETMVSVAGVVMKLVVYGIDASRWR